VIWGCWLSPTLREEHLRRKTPAACLPCAAAFSICDLGVKLLFVLGTVKIDATQVGASVHLEVSDKFGVKKRLEFFDTRMEHIHIETLREFHVRYSWARTRRN